MNWSGAITALTSDPLRLYAEEPPGWGGMSIAQRQLHEAPNRLRASISANSTGKSFSGAAETWWHLLNLHPFREVQRDTGVGWVLCPDLKSGWPNISRVLHELEPPGVLDPKCQYILGSGYTYRSKRQLKIRSELGGGLLIGQGCIQPVMSLEGHKIDWLWVDEPPKEGHWAACRSRVDRTLGPIWLTATPIGRPVEWLREMLEGDPDTDTAPEPGWWVRHFALTPEHAPHLSDEQIQALINGCRPWEMPQRIRAEWEGYTVGRMVPGFTEANLFDFEGDHDLDPYRDVEAFGLGADYGEKPGNTIWYLGCKRTNGHVYFLGEWCPPERLTEAEEARGVKQHLLDPFGLSVHQITHVRGDSNSAGRRGIALKVNDLMMRAFAALTKDNRPPFEIRPPYKGPGSVKARARMMNTAFLERRAWVHVSCVRLQSTLRHWMGENNDLKHAFDASGYLCEDWIAPGFRRNEPRHTFVR